MLFGFIRNIFKEAAQRKMDAALYERLIDDGRRLACFTHTKAAIEDASDPAKIVLLCREKGPDGPLYYREYVTRDKIEHIMNDMVSVNARYLSVIANIDEPLPQNHDMYYFRKMLDHKYILKIFKERRDIEKTIDVLKNVAGITIRDPLADAATKALAIELKHLDMDKTGNALIDAYADVTRRPDLSGQIAMDIDGDIDVTHKLQYKVRLDPVSRN